MYVDLIIQNNFQKLINLSFDRLASHLGWLSPRAYQLSVAWLLFNKIMLINAYKETYKHRCWYIRQPWRPCMPEQN